MLQRQLASLWSGWVGWGWVWGQASTLEQAKERVFISFRSPVSWSLQGLREAVVILPSDRRINDRCERSCGTFWVMRKNRAATGSSYELPTPPQKNIRERLQPAPLPWSSEWRSLIPLKTDHQKLCAFTPQTNVTLQRLNFVHTHACKPDTWVWSWIKKNGLWCFGIVT